MRWAATTMPDWTSGNEDARQADYRDEGIHKLARGPKRPQSGAALPRPEPVAPDAREDEGAA